MKHCRMETFRSASDIGSRKERSEQIHFETENKSNIESACNRAKEKQAQIH